MPEQIRRFGARNWNEVTLGYTEDQALAEAARCIQCKKPGCIAGLPGGHQHPGLHPGHRESRLRKAYDVLAADNVLPAICGRVCPQETQCEAVCIVGNKLEPVGIGRLERFVGDMALKNGWSLATSVKPNGHKAAMIGSGPASITCAVDLARAWGRRDHLRGAAHRRRRAQVRHP